MAHKKDWKGNGKAIFSTLGASNHSDTDRELYDYYATDPAAAKHLLNIETFSPDIWECACGEGHLSKVLEAAGHNVRSTDIIDRGYGNLSGGGDRLFGHRKPRLARRYNYQPAIYIRPGICTKITTGDGAGSKTGIIPTYTIFRNKRAKATFPQFSTSTGACF